MKEEYMRRLIAEAKRYLPEWLYRQLHATALPLAGADARWAEPQLSPFEKMALAEMRPEMLRKVPDSELRIAWLRLNQWYKAAKRRRQAVEEFVNAAVWVIQEMERRGMEVSEDNELASEAAKLSKEVLKAVTRGTPLRYFGSINPLWSKLSPLFPEHDTFVMPACGPAEFFFLKDPVETEVLGDINDEPIELFKIIRSLSDADIEALSKRNWTAKKELWKQLYDDVRNQRFGDKSDKLYKHLYVMHWGEYTSDAGGRKFMGLHEGKVWVGVESKLRFARDRLRNVKEFRVSDFEETIKKYDSPSTFFFLDPPWVGRDWWYPSSKISGDFDWDRLLELAKSIKGKLMVIAGDGRNAYRVAKKFGNVRGFTLPVPGAYAVSYTHLTLPTN